MDPATVTLDELVDDEEWEILEDAGIVSCMTSGNTRTVTSVIRSTRFAPESLYFTGVSTGASVCSDSRQNTFAHGEFDIPDLAESVEGLEWIGFTGATAFLVFEMWHSRPASDPLGLVDYARWRTIRLQMPQYENLSHVAAMTKLGLHPRSILTVLAAMDLDQYKCLSLGSHINKMLLKNWLALLDLYRRLKKAAAVISVEKERQEAAKQMDLQHQSHEKQ